MKIKKHLMKIIIILLSSVLAISSVSAITVNLIKKNDTKEKQIKGSKFIFDGIEFNSMNEALEYAKNLIKYEKIDNSSKKLWSISFKNNSYLFNNPTELNAFLNSQIKILPTVTDVKNHKLNPSDNSLYNSNLYYYNIDTSNNRIIEPELMCIYESSSDTYKYASFNDDNSNEIVKQQAKDSFLEIHRSYYFNGIYFKSKQDLEIYLKKHYIKEAIGNIDDTTYYKKIISPKNIEIKSNPINFESLINSNINDDEYQKINLEIGNFLKTNSYEYIKIGNKDPHFIKIIDNSLNYEDVQDVKIEELPIIQLKSNKNKSLFIVDASYDEQYNFIGPYFLETDGLIENITNKSLWKVSNDNPEEIIQSEAISMFSSFLDLFLLPPGMNWTTRNYGLSYNNGYYLKDENVLFNIVNYDDTGKLKDLEYKMYLELMKVKYDDSNTIYDKFIKTIRTLVNTKNFNSFYAIPILYAFLIESIVNCYAPLETYIAVKDYFIEICNLYDSILYKLFGKDILTKYDALYSENELMEQEIFSFSKFFGINEFGFDFNSLSTLLSGNKFIRDYKQLFVASYVFLQAILNSQNNFKLNYDVRSDNTILQIVAEGINEDQNNVNKIKEKFNWNINGTSVYDKLEHIYNSVNKMSEIIENEIKDNVLNMKMEFSDKSFDEIKTLLDKYEVDHASMEFEQLFNNLQNILNPTKIYRNDNYNDLSKKIIISNFKTKFTTKYKSSLKLCYEMKSSLDNNQFYDSFKSLNNLSLSDKNLLINELKEQFKYEIEIQEEFETSYEFLTQTKTIHEMVQQDDSIKNKIANIESNLNKMISALKTGISIATSINQIILDANNDFYPEDVKAELIAKTVLNMLSTICDFTGNLVPSPFGTIIKSIGAVFSFVSGILGEAKQQIYEFIIRGNDGSETKYYWDGGLVMSRLFGLVSETKRDINDLKILSPIKITNPRITDVVYFDRKKYNEIDASTSIKKDAIIKIFNDGIKGYNFSKVYSLNGNLNNEYEQSNDLLSFEKIYDSDLSNKNTLSQYVITQVVDSIKTGKNFQFVSEINGELFFNGYKFNSLEEFEATLESRILNEIKATYVCQMPLLDENNVPLDTRHQQTFRLPYPYFEPSNNDENQIIWSNPNEINERERRYIISNGNQKEGSNYLSEQKIINNIKLILSENEPYL